MGQQNKQSGFKISDSTLLIVCFVCVFLYFVSSFMYIDADDIKEANQTCHARGGLQRYYLHFNAKKFECKDGTSYLIRKKTF